MVVQKVLENVTKNNEFALQTGPKTSQDAPKMAFGPLLGRSWRSWAALGRSWAGLGPLLAALGSILVRLEFAPGRSWAALGAIQAPSRSPGRKFTHAARPA